MTNHFIKLFLSLVLILPLGAQVELPGVNDPLILEQEIIEARLDLVKKLIESHKYREALSELQDFQSRVSKNSRILAEFWMGKVHRAVAEGLGKGEITEDSYGNLYYLEEAIVQENLKAYSNALKGDAGSARNADFYYDQAIIHMNIVLRSGKTHPYQEAAVLELAEIYQQQKKYESALKNYDNFIRQYTQSILLTDVLIRRANLLFDMDQLHNALQAFREILDVYPEVEEKAYIELKISYIQQLLAARGELDSDDAEVNQQLIQKLRLLQSFEAEMMRKRQRLEQMQQKLEKKD